MKTIITTLLFCISLSFAQLTVYDYAETNSGGKISFKIQNTSESTIDVTGYSIVIYASGDTYPTEIHQQPQSGTTGFEFTVSTDCGGNNYAFSGTSVSGTVIPSGQCWFGTTYHCTQSMEFWFGQNGEIPLTHESVVILDNNNNIVYGTIPTWYETCGIPISSSSSSESSSSSSAIACTEDVIVYDTTHVPVSVDSFYNVGVPVDSFYNVGVPVDSFYNIGVPVDSFYNVGVPVDSFYTVPVQRDSIIMIPKDSLVTVIVHDTIRDTSFILISVEKEIDFNLTIQGREITSIYIGQTAVTVRPILYVEVNITGLNPDDVVTMDYTVYVYDAIGQYVDDVTGTDDLPVYNGKVIGTYEYDLLTIDENGFIVNKQGRKYGNGAYVMTASVRIYINGSVSSTRSSMNKIGVMRPIR